MLRSASLAALLACLCQVALAAEPMRLNTTFNVIMRVGDQLPGPDGKMATLGMLIDAKGAPILSDKGKPILDDGPDFMSYLKVDGKLYGIVQFETAPAPYYMLEIDESKEGHLGAVALQAVDASGWEGSIRPCAGSITPWNTHLGGEENYLNVRGIEADINKGQMPTDGYDAWALENIMKYKGAYLLNDGTSGDKPMLEADNFGVEADFYAPDAMGDYIARVKKEFKPYMYGHNVEIKVDDGKPVFTKVFALGRSSFEAGYVLPDSKTVYLSDDAKGGGLLKFVADTPGDLSVGTMYAAKIAQTNYDAKNLPETLKGTVSWVNLGKLDHAILEKEARKPISEFGFSDIFLSMAVTNTSKTADKYSYACDDVNFKLVFWDRNWECLKINTATPNVEMLAAGLETRRYISYMGATTEFVKMEGLTFYAKALSNGGKGKIFLAISYQDKSMDANDAKWEQLTDIRVKKNYCGCTYAFDLDADYSATNVYPQVCGEMITIAGKKTCAMDKPSNPDNLNMMDGYPWLVVSEDSGNRHQDLLMMHNVETLENIIVAAAETTGSEVTAGWFHEMEGSKYSYITANYQVDERAPLGYLGPFSLEGVKDVTFEPNRLFDANFMNPYSDYYKNKGMDQLRPFQQFGVRSSVPMPTSKELKANERQADVKFKMDDAMAAKLQDSTSTEYATFKTESEALFQSKMATGSKVTLLGVTAYPSRRSLLDTTVTGRYKFSAPSGTSSSGAADAMNGVLTKLNSDPTGFLSGANLSGYKITGASATDISHSFKSSASMARTGLLVMLGAVVALVM